MIQGQTEGAARLFAWADTMCEKIGDPRPPVEQGSVERDLELIHSHLNDSDFARLCAEGQKLTVEEAVALAWIRSRDPAVKKMIVQWISPFEPSTPIRRKGLRRTGKPEYTGACDRIGSFRK